MVEVRVAEEDAVNGADLEDLGRVVESRLMELQPAVEQEAVIPCAHLDAAASYLLRRAMKDQIQASPLPFSRDGEYINVSGTPSPDSVRLP